VPGPTASFLFVIKLFSYIVLFTVDVNTTVVEDTSVDTIKADISNLQNNLQTSLTNGNFNTLLQNNSQQLSILTGEPTLINQNITISNGAIIYRCRFSVVDYGI
jgi:hypothetical protein